MKKYILFGAGNEGINALNYIDKRLIDCFLDNDSSKWGTFLEGIPIFMPSVEVIADKQIYLTVSWRFVSQIQKQLQEMGVYNVKLFQEYIVANCSENEKIKMLQNKYRGKRCFLIGTGPSLTIADLEMLKSHGELCFASNKIFKLFDQTKWRPDLYCISDNEVFSFYYDRICSMNIKEMFLVNIAGTRYKNSVDLSKLEATNKFIFNIWYEKKRADEGLPAFSKNPAKYVVDGGITVTYSMLQFAYFLGFKEIYLLGVDFNYGDMTGKDKNKADHFCSDYIEKGEIVNYPKLDDTLAAYNVAEQFSYSNGFRIYNATRGGKLDVFERVNLEDVLKEVKE